jgi:hypothetical protein
MAYVTFDTPFIVSHRVSSLPDNFLLSGVVVMELMASANDESARKVFEAMRAAHERDGTLIVPRSEDSLRAGSLGRAGKLRSSGREPPRAWPPTR